MRFSSAPAISILAFALLSEVARAHCFDGHEGSFRELKAAAKHSHLLRRNHEIRPTRVLDMVFTDEENVDERPVFASRVQAEADHPILSIEEFEHHLDTVECTDLGSQITLKFRTTYGFQMAKRATEGFHDGLVVTSHLGCNELGERRPYKVRQISHSDDVQEIALTVEPKTWKKAFRYFSIEYGYSTERHVLRRHSPLSDRLKPGQVLPGYKALVPTATPSATSATISLQHSLVDQELKLPIGPGIPIDTRCKNCSTFGTLELTQGKFDIMDPDDFLDEMGDLVDSNPNDSFDIIQKGSVEVSLNDFGVHVELQSSLSAKEEFAIPLFHLPVVGFAIPGFGRAGLNFAPELTSSFAVTAPIQLTYGFDVIMPKVSMIHLDLAHFDRSFQKGFNDKQAHINAITPQLNTSAAKLTLTASFRPRLVFGFSFLDDAITAEVSVFVDLPQLELDLAELPDVDADCLPLPAPDNRTAAQDDAAHLFDDLTRVQSSVNLNLGVDFALDIENPFDVFDLNGPIQVETDVNILSTKFPIQSDCLSYDAAHATFVPATEVLSSVRASRSSAAASRSSVAAALSSEAEAQVSATETSSGAGGCAAAPVSFRGGVVDSLAGVVVFIAGLLIAL